MAGSAMWQQLVRAATATAVVTVMVLAALVSRADGTGAISGGSGAATRYAQISAGGYHSCAVTTGGKGVCWGDNDHGQTTVPAGRYTQISAGRDHSCAVTTTRKAVCWGGRLTVEVTASIVIGEPRNVHGRVTVPAGRYTQISAGRSPAGREHSCAVTTDGKGVCWGSNSYGQTTVPAGRYTQISAGSLHSCAVTRTGKAVCWGRRQSGRALPAGRYKQISAGSYHSCAVTTSGKGVCWGRNDGRTTVPAGRYTQISAGSLHSCAVTAAGKAVCWGNDGYGQTSVPPGR